MLVGIDEVGRGALAGPVVACACILPEDELLYNHIVLRDSKTMTPKMREASSSALAMVEGVKYTFGQASHKRVDEVGIGHATLEAMRQAVEALMLPDTAKLLVDGLQRIPGLPFKQKPIVGGDSKYACISAASILAKVHRDTLMSNIDSCYDVYGFNDHKGYGTKAHLQALATYGPCEYHRMTFKGVRNHVK